MTNHEATAHAPELDVAVIGAGFSGLYMLHRLRELGFSVRVYETGDGVGGTWYWNRYPGARCDSESHIYSYSFSEELQQEWEWSCRYPDQAEILRYLNHVADKFDLRRDIALRTRITAAVFEEDTNRWTLTTDGGESVSARFCVTGVGCLSATQVPDIPGLEAFTGEWYHTGRWPHEGVDFAGKRVAVIGTGSTGIQAIPVIAESAAELTVFQRTPNFSVPARNVTRTEPERREIKANYDAIRATTRGTFAGFDFDIGESSALGATPGQRQREYQANWDRGGLRFVFGSEFGDLVFSEEANETAAEFVRSKIRETVRDPATAEKLSPRDHPIGTKRPPIDTGYYETFNRDTVRLVDVNESPIEEITSTGIRTRDEDHPVDVIVFATGFDAMTGALLAMDIRGRGGQSLRDKWADGPRTYLGLATAGFPNLFLITGPGSPSVLSNMPVSIEQHVDWIADCLDYLRRHGRDRIEATAEAEDAWVAHANEVAGTTLLPRADSWWRGANIPGKPQVLMPYIGGVGAYRQHCAEVAADDYAGFATDRDAATAGA